MNVKNLIIFAVASVLTACGGSSDTVVKDSCDELSNADFSCEVMLDDIVSKGVLPAVEQFEVELNSLQTKVSDYCENISDSSKHSLAKEAWASVMAPLQQLEVMNFGPNTDTANGLRSFYDWQTANPINIDIAIAKNNLFEQVGLSNSDNEKDLVAIEYILFKPGFYTVTVNENPNVLNWRTGKTSDEIQQDRCDYAVLIATDMKTRSAALTADWQSFDLASVSASKQVAANQVVDALFYIDKITKDLKIKATLPQPDDVDSAFKPEKLESQFAYQSKEAILNNLIGVKTILTLNDIDDSKIGIDDYLKSAGQDELAIEMNVALNAAIINVMAIDGVTGTDDATIFSAVDNASSNTDCTVSSGNGTYLDNSSDIVTFCALQYQVKTFTDILKGDFTFLTSFTVPASASGDND